MFYKTLKLAIPYASELAAKGISLQVPSNSHLKSLVGYSRLDNPQNTIQDTDFVQAVENVTIMEGGVSEHEAFMGNLVDELAPLVQTHIRIAREVGALSKALAENVRKYLDATPHEDATSQFNIIKDELGELFDEAAVLGAIEVGAQGLHYDGRPLATGPRDFETILGYLTTGRKEIDIALQNTIGQFDRSFLEQIWMGMFNHSVSSNSPYLPNNIMSLPSGERLAVAYITHCIACRVYEEVPDDSIGSLNEFQKNVAALRDWSLSIAKFALAERHNQIKSNVVALGYNPASRTVIVNGPVYRDWLEKGGQVEALLGCLLSDCNAYSAGQLNEKSATYVNQWNSFASFHNAESDLRRSRFMRSIYLVAFTEAMSEIQPFEEEYRKSHQGFAEKAVSAAERLLSATGIQALENVEDVCLELMAGIRFEYTPAKIILTLIDRTLKTTPDADVREAALVAACGYIARYLSGQLSIQRNG